MGVAADLQNAINRFSGDSMIGFDRIGVDDVIGPDTYAGAIMALDIVQAGCPSFDNCPNPAMLQLSADATTLWGAINTPADVTANAAALLANLSQAADTLGFGAVQPPPPTTIIVAKKPPATRGIILAATKAKIDKATSFLGLGLPSWAPYAGGVVLVVGVIAAIASHVKKHQRTAVASWR
jgi:hypothetical protein